MSSETRAAPREQFCWRCGHDPHDERSDPRCGEIVGGGDQPMPEPVYCGCVDADALYVRAIRAEAAALAARPALDALRLGGLIERAIREHQRKLRDEGRVSGLMPDGWTIAKMVLAYPPQTPTEPSQASRLAEQVR